MREGIHMLQGGKGVFGPMSIRENLETSAFVFRDDKARVAERLDHAYELFPELAKRPGALAGDLSGGATADAGPGPADDARARGAPD